MIDKQQQLKWDKRFMEVAKLVSSWSSCIRENRQVGCVIVKNNCILATGHNGAPSGIKSCQERGVCLRNQLNIKSGTCLEKCYSLCAEQKAVAQASKLGHELDNSTLYCTHSPCTVCAKMIINTGIKRVVFEQNYPDEFSLGLLKEAGIEVVQLNSDK